MDTDDTDVDAFITALKEQPLQGEVADVVVLLKLHNDKTNTPQPVDLKLRVHLSPDTWDDSVTVRELLKDILLSEPRVLPLAVKFRQDVQAQLAILSEEEEAQRRIQELEAEASAVQARAQAERVRLAELKRKREAPGQEGAFFPLRVGVPVSLD